MSDSPKTIAALFVKTGGAYYGLDGVDPWDIVRDARAYPGPYPVVAHPPCARWSSLAPLVEKTHGYKRGEDGGCFASALASVRKWGGVLEHPARSAAWRAHRLLEPLGGGWSIADDLGGWTCRIEQGYYGHRARKPTWLYLIGHAMPPSLRWGKHTSQVRVASTCTRKTKDGYTSKNVDGVSHATLTAKEALATPPEFRDLLISLARECSAPLIESKRVWVADSHIGDAR